MGPRARDHICRRLTWEHGLADPCRHVRGHAQALWSPRPELEHEAAADTRHEGARAASPRRSVQRFQGACPAFRASGYAMVSSRHRTGQRSQVHGQTALSEARLGGACAGRQCGAVAAACEEVRRGATSEPPTPHQVPGGGELRASGHRSGREAGPLAQTVRPSETGCLERACFSARKGCVSQCCPLLTAVLIFCSITNRPQNAAAQDNGSFFLRLCGWPAGAQLVLGSLELPPAGQSAGQTVPTACQQRWELAVSPVSWAASSPRGLASSHRPDSCGLPGSAPGARGRC